MNEDWLQRRLASIERRLTVIEREIGVRASRNNLIEAASAIPQPHIEPVPAGPPPLPAFEVPSAQSVEPIWSTPPVEMAARTESVIETQPPTIPALPATAAIARSLPAPGFEQTIGLKWAGWIGAVVLTIGAALGIRFAYDQGWFGRIPDEAKLALMSLAGVALLVAGEIVYRRIDKIAAAALFGAGVAIFFLVSFAGFNYYHLYERDTAFIGMGFSTLLGAAVALRGGMVSIAVLSLIGGNIAPIALQSDHPRLIPFLAYLLMLQIVALALCLFGRGARWWTLRGLSLATTSFWMGSIYFLWDTLPRGWDAACLFTLIYAAIYHLELLLSARRFDARVARGDVTDLVSPARARAGMVFAVLVTALLEAALLWLFRDESQEIRGVLTLALAAIAGGIGWILATGNRGPSTANHSIGYRIQAAALLIVAVPVALSGIWVVLAWAGLALAFAVLGAALNLPISRRAAVVTWFLGLLYLAAWTAGSIIFPGVRSTWLTILSTPIPKFAVLAWMLSIAAHAIAVLLQSDWTPDNVFDEPVEAGTVNPTLQYETPRIRPRRIAPEFARLSIGITIAAAMVWCGAALLALPSLGATFMFVAYVWLVFAAEAITPARHLKRHAITTWAFAAIKWSLVDGLFERISPEWSAAKYLPVANPFFLMGGLVALTAGGFYLKRLRDIRADVPFHPAERSSFPLAVSAAVTLILLLGFGFEIDRGVERSLAGLAWNPTQLKNLLWTPLAMVGACVMLAIARKHAPKQKDRPTWAQDLEWVPLLIAAKFLIVDTLVFRALYGVALSNPIFNVETMSGLVVGAGIVYALRADRPASTTASSDARLKGSAALAIVMIFLWAGSLEIDRAFSRMAVERSTAFFADPARAEQVVLSIFWSVFAVAAVILGFRFRTAALRYVGLGLFAVTLLKVVAVDMSQFQTGYRILSFLGLGGLLLGTSVLYGKLSPRLLSVSGG